MHDGDEGSTTLPRNSADSSTASRPMPDNAEAGPSRTEASATDTDAELPGLKWYISDLDRHMKRSAAHLDGRLSLAHNDLPHTQFEWSVIPPSNCLWTSDEKALFFAALARHSRLRPDLISLDVGTKSVALVEEYLAALRWGKQHLGDRIRQHDESRQWRDHLIDTGAYSVDDLWLEIEEEFSETLDRLITDAAVPARRKRAPSSETLLNEYGGSLDVDKLSTLDGLLKVSEEKSTTDLVGIYNSESSSDDDEDPIVKDNREIEKLDAIAKKERTPAQRARLRTLVNRKRNRQQYRLRALLKQGMTQNQITEGGGPDAVFGRQPDKSLALESRPGAKRKKHAESIAVHDPEIVRLGELGMDRYLTQQGWELFNYAHMGDAITAYAKAHSDRPAPAISFPVLGELYTEVLAYLKPLVYQAVIIAEQQAVQNKTEEVDVAHVRGAIALRGEKRPREVFSEAKKQFSGIGSEAGTPDRSSRRNSTANPVTPDRTHRPRSQSPSRSSSPSRSRSSSRSRSRSRSRSPLQSEARRPPSPPRTFVEHDLTSWMDAGVVPPDISNLPEAQTAVDPLDDEWEIISTVTDDEDEALDDALDVADSALDNAVSRQLDHAVVDNDTRIIIDGTAWVNAKERQPARKRKRRDTGATEAEDEDEDVRDAQQAYRDLIATIQETRRNRRAVRRRTELFPRTSTFKEGGRVRVRHTLGWRKARKGEGHWLVGSDESEMEVESDEGVEEWVASGTGSEGEESEESEEAGWEGDDGEGEQGDEVESQADAEVDAEEAPEEVTEDQRVEAGDGDSDENEDDERETPVPASDSMEVEEDELESSVQEDMDVGDYDDGSQDDIVDTQITGFTTTQDPITHDTQLTADTYSPEPPESIGSIGSMGSSDW